MKIKLSLLLISAFLVTSCASTTDVTERPEWIDHAQELYPSDTYLTAVGQASKRDRAAKSATVNLVEIFSVEVRAQTNVLTEATKTESAVSVTTESSTALQRTIETETDQAVSGVEIKESWLSPDGEYYALAVLEKQKLATSLRETISELDQSTAAHIDFSINAAVNEIASINALRLARDDQIARQLANMQLKQVSLGGVPSDISSTKIEQLITKKIAKLNVSVSAKGELHKQTVESGVAAMGIRVTDNAKINVAALIDVGEPTLIKKWYWLRGSYQLSVSENGKVVSRKRWPIKVSAKEKELLNSRIEDKLNNKISSYIIELVSDSPSL